MTAPEAAFDGSLTVRGSKSSQVAYSEQISIVLTLNEATGLGNRPRPISRLSQQDNGHRRIAQVGQIVS